MRRFRKSSAVAAYIKTLKKGEVFSVAAFQQFVIDNFDCAVTHALAMITIGPSGGEDVDYDDMIPSITKAEMSRPVCELYDEMDVTAVVEYTGQKNPSPPPMPSTDLPEEVLARQEACIQFAKDLDFEFLCDVITKDGTPEYNGYLTAKCRE